MTGFGEARHSDDRMTVAVEVRSVNNRHLKLHAKLGEPFSAMEPEVERLVREAVRRGTIQLSLRVDRPRRAEDYRLNVVALESYRDQVASLAGIKPRKVKVGPLLGLPGVVEGRRETAEDPREDWPLVSGVIVKALEAFAASRAEEGRAMASELRSLAGEVAQGVKRIEERVPVAMAALQERLRERVQALVEGLGVTIEAKDLIRETAILAERADVAEELTRLRAHLEQFVGVLDEPESGGRKLEFIVQEMGRETNTTGSKSNDVEISRIVFGIKAALEKIRELIANIE